jgi:hypothetical protein
MVSNFGKLFYNLDPLLARQQLLENMYDQRKYVPEAEIRLHSVEKTGK